MFRRNTQAVTYFSYRVIFTAFIASLLLTTLTGWELLQIYSVAKEKRSTSFEGTLLLHRLQLESNALRTAAHTVVFNPENPKWEKTYLDLKHSYHVDLQILVNLFPESFKTGPGLDFLHTLPEIEKIELSSLKNKWDYKKRHHSALFTPSYQKEVHALSKQFQELHTSINEKLTTLRADQRERAFWVALLIGLIGLIILGIWAYVLSIVKAHIKERKAHEAESKRYTKELEKLNQELDQFAYVTSHDLKAPLRAIANLSKWIEEDIEESLERELPADIKKNLSLMQGRVHRMEALIDGILQYSRIGRVHVDREEVNVKELLDETIDLLSVPNGFQISYPDDFPCVQASKVRLGQIFSNLISNSIKYHDHPENGRTEIGWQPRAGGYEFYVKDNGPGISPEFHEKVFIIFQTLQSRDQVESTGVGLALVKKIVEEQGGKVELRSEAGKGAEFRFFWPTETVTQKTAPIQPFEKAA